MRRAAAAIAAALILFSPAVAQEQLAPAEQCIAGAVDGSTRDAEALLERVVNINSGTMNFAGVKHVGEIFQPRRSSCRRARRQGSARLLIGHLDTFDDSYPPMAPTDGNRKLLVRLDEVSRALGFGPITPVAPRAAGAADISFVANDVDMAIDALGLKGKAEHTTDETADVRLLPAQIKRAAVLLYRLTH